MPELDAAGYFRQAIERLAREINALEREPVVQPVGARLHKARLELAIAEAELAAIELRDGIADEVGATRH